MRATDAKAGNSGFERAWRKDLEKRTPAEAAIRTKNALAASGSDYQEEGDMLNITNGPSFMQERLLMQEITHRVNNEFASAIGMVSLAAARSDNAEVKVVLNEITDLLHNYAAVHRALQMPEQHEHIDAA